jgi:outer membrane protein OmpA-like peptidoglycan-associated protein/Tol biopolymer transport system component
MHNAASISNVIHANYSTMRHYTLLFFLCVAFITNAQTYITKEKLSSRLKKDYEEAAKLMQYEVTIPKARDIFTNLVKKEPTFIDGWYMLGATNYDTRNYAEGLKNFEKSLALDAKYEPKVSFYAAMCAYNIEKYKEAITYYEQFLSQKPSSASLVAKTNNYLKQCRFAAEAVAHPVPFSPISISDKINTNTEAEYLPSLTADGETLIYTKRIRGQEDFYMSKKVNNEWQTGIAMDNINTQENEGAQTISADGKRLVFTACNRNDGLGSCDLYIAEQKNNVWTTPTNLKIPINTRAWESQPSLSADGNTLYFASRRTGGLGGADIWMTTCQPNGTWSEPTNIGAPINTPADDQSPFLHPDGETMYFMSNGHPGMGGHDLFVTRKNTQGAWETPMNLGYPINTKADEGALVVSLDGKTAYFASDRKYIGTVKEGKSVFATSTAATETDIYSFSLYEAARPRAVTYAKGTVRDANTKLPLAANIAFFDLKEKKLLIQTEADPRGQFLVCLPAGKNYALEISKEKYVFYSDNFSLADSNSLQKPYVLDVLLQPIPEKTVTTSTSAPIIGKPIILKNVFFETGSAALKPESQAELDRLKQLLLENKTMRIQLNGHTDDVGADADNLTLSTNRAKAVYDYLIKNGIVSSRLTYKGFGELQPIDTNSTDAGRKNNRRTEFLVVGN